MEKNIKLKQPKIKSISNIADLLNSKGYVIFNNQLNIKDLQFFQSKIKNFSANMDEHFSIPYPEKMLGIDNKNLINFLKKLVGNDGDYSFVSYLRHSCLNSGKLLKYHYDASLVTLVLPIQISTNDSEKEIFSLVPNNRGLRKSVLFNLIEKSFYQNFFTQFLINKLIKKKLLFKPVTVLANNCFFIFNGYRTLHATFPLMKDESISLYLIHFGNPHHRSILLKLILSLRMLFEKIKLQIINKLSS